MFRELQILLWDLLVVAKSGPHVWSDLHKGLVEKNVWKDGSLFGSRFSLWESNVKYLNSVLLFILGKNGNVSLSTKIISYILF